MYHGSAGISAGLILKDFHLVPRLRNPNNMKAGYGPYGDPNCVYLSDTFAMCSAFHSEDCCHWAVIAETVIDDSYLRAEYPYGCKANLLIPDQTYYLLKKYPQLDWRIMQRNRDIIVQSEHIYDGKEPRDYTWQQSYEEIGSFGVWLGAGTKLRSIPVTRVLVIDIHQIDLNYVMAVEKILPTLDITSEERQELREYHANLFEEPLEGMTVYDQPSDLITEAILHPDHLINTVTL